MTEVSGSSAARARHFSDDEENALRADESTNAIVKRDTGLKANLHGLDRTWGETKEHQRMPHGAVEKGAAGVHAGHAILEGSDGAGIVEHLLDNALDSTAASIGATAVIGGTLLGFALGCYVLNEAEENAISQNEAVKRDQAHFAVINVLDLPKGYQKAQCEGRYKGVPREWHDAATTMTNQLKADPKAVAVLQLHCDRGMNAAKLALASGMTMESFLRVNPKVAEAYRQDAAFKEGFDAYLYTKGTNKAAAAEMDAKLIERDAWYTQSSVSYRV